MRLLLDTQVMLWWMLGDSRLSNETRRLMTAHACMISVASIWEIAIKQRIGKLSVDPVLFRDQCLVAGARQLAINDAHVIETGRLACVHEDPFDRLIIAQARIEGMTAVSSDSRWQEYDVALRHA